MSASSLILHSRVLRNKYVLLFQFISCSVFANPQPCSGELPLSPRVDDFKVALKCIERKLDRPSLYGLPIGSIVASVVPPEKIKEVYGSSFILANGQKVSSHAAYARLFGETQVPDLRGMFLRGLNYGRNDGKEDPDGKARLPGSYQLDDFKAHSHSTVQMVYNNADDGVDSAVTGSYEHRNKERRTGVSGHLETRPRNIGVYYYIKVN